MMKRSRKELKLMARRALRGHYGTVVGAFFLAYLMMGLFLVPLYVAALFGMFFVNVNAVRMTVPMIAGMLGIYLLFLVVMSFVIGGYRCICYRLCTGQPTRVEDMTYALHRHPMRFVGISLLLTVFGMVASLPVAAAGPLGRQFVTSSEMRTALTLICSVVSIILVILLELCYAFTFIILVEDPERSVRDCFRLSRELMNGNKIRLVKQGLSFLGMMLLTYLTFGLAFLWVTPYMICTNIYLYLDIKEEKFPPRSADYGDYGDFYI